MHVHAAAMQAAGHSGCVAAEDNNALPKTGGGFISEVILSVSTQSQSFHQGQMRTKPQNQSFGFCFVFLR